MRKFLIAEIKTSKLIWGSIPAIGLLYLIMTSLKEESLGYIIYAIVITIVTWLLPHAIFAILGPKKMFIFNWFRMYSVPYDSIHYIWFGYYRTRYNEIPTIELKYKTKGKVRTAHIFYKMYRKSDLIELMNILIDKNSNIENSEEMEKRMYRIHESPRKVGSWFKRRK